VKTGKNITIYSQAKIVYPENCYIGNNVIIDDFVFIMAKPFAKIGNFVHIAGFTSIAGGGAFIIEDYSTLSWGVRIFTGTEDVSGRSLLGVAIPEPYRKAVRSYVHIGKHVMVGANSVILPGVTVPDGVIIGAMSLVLEDTELEPWTVYAGIPVRKLREQPRERMLELERDLEST